MDWNKLTEEVRTLAQKIDYKPDIVIGVVRGGIIPARLLAKELGVKDMYCLTVKKREGIRVVTSDILEEIQGKHILLVEDMLETGRSLVTAKQYLVSKGAQVMTACLYTVPLSECKPDFCLREVLEVVAFPWE